MRVGMRARALLVVQLGVYAVWACGTRVWGVMVVVVVVDSV